MLGQDREATAVMESVGANVACDNDKLQTRPGNGAFKESITF